MNGLGTRSALVREAERRNRREQRNEKAIIAILAAFILVSFIVAGLFGGVQ